MLHKVKCNKQKKGFYVVEDLLKLEKITREDMLWAKLWLAVHYFFLNFYEFHFISLKKTGKDYEESK